MNALVRCMMVMTCLAMAAGLPAPARAAQAGAKGPLVLSRQQFAHASGEQIFRHVCQGCHMPDAQGATGAGDYPALADDPHLASARFMAAVVLHGRRNMPSFMTRSDLTGFAAMMHVSLSDAEIAAVVNYVRTHFGNHFKDKLSAADVKALHPTTQESP